MSDKEWLTVSDLMDELQVSRATAYRLTETIPVTRFGRAIRINRRDLNRYLAIEKNIPTLTRDEQHQQRAKRINTRFHKALMDGLQEKGMTSQDLAEAIGIKSSRMAAIYRGDEPSLSEAIAISNELLPASKPDNKRFFV